MGNNKGFTLVEMIVAMAIFMGIMIMATYGFERVLVGTGQQTKSAQSNFEGVVGLEMLRYDVEHAGYGLPWDFLNYASNSEIQFQNLGGTANKELDVGANVPVAGIDAASLNAVYTDDIHAFSAGTATKEVGGTAVSHSAGGPDYLVMRSVISALDDATSKWTYVNYSGNTTGNYSKMKEWDSSEDLTSADRFITIRSTFTTSGEQNKTLLMDGSNFEVSVSAGGDLPAGDAFKPADAAQVVVAYGIRSASESALRMPYNRTDFFVSRPTDKMPQWCNPGTGILYKTMVDHGTGEFGPPYPLLECIGDLQVEFEYDEDEDGDAVILPPALLNTHTAHEIRSHLKNVRIYILTHEGKMDRGYNYPKDSIHVGDPNNLLSGRILTSSDMASMFTADWRKYRWKIYTMVVRPKNLNQ